MSYSKMQVIAMLLLLSILMGFNNIYSDNLLAELTQEDIASLYAGNIIVKKHTQKTPQGEIARVVGAIQIQKPIEEVWKCILDWESMSHYVDGLDYYKVITKINSTTWVIEGQIHVVFLKFRYTLIVNNQKSKYFQQWRLISDSDCKEYKIKDAISPHSSGIKNIEGYQYCIPLDDKSTILYYAPVVEVSVPVPGFIENSLTQKSIKDYLYGVKKYLEKK
ncbi:MAG: hypothetical protein N3F66_10505 [Spirochaetes bacterium]|nr:hypothetical protein [Spirochaetota bacterium]